MDSFYVVLPSNTPETVAQVNTISNYTVRLPNSLDLSDGDWSVALSSIIYPVSFQADSRDEMYVGIEYSGKNKAPKKIVLPPDLTFSSIEILEKTLNETILGHVIKEQQPTTRMRREVPVEEVEEEEVFDREKREGLTEKELKMLAAATNEVQTRSFDAAQLLSTEIEDKITEIEMMGAKVEALQFGMELNMVINENFGKEEAEDINQKIKRARDDAIKLRNTAQQKRRDLANALAEYAQLVTDFDSLKDNLPEARRLANKAKGIVKRLEELSEWLDKDKLSVKTLLDYLFETSAELKQMVKPLDIGTKNTIARIKEAILAKVVKLSDLEIYFYYDQNFGRFFLYSHRPMEIRAVKLSPRLAFMLGFEIDKINHEVKHVRIRRDGGFAKFTPDIKAGVHQLYVYMPGIINSTYVGNVQVPLLRIINVDKPPNSIAESIYSNMHFIRVTEKRISSIKIQIHDSFGEFIKFNWGSVIITLAFKRSLF